MITLQKIEELAQKSKLLEPLPDAYANERCAWAHDEKNRGKDMWWGVDQPYYRFLYHVALNNAGGVAIEVGTHAGIGFSCLAAGAKASGNKKSWTVGIDKDNHATAIEVATKYDNCHFINGISTKVVDKVEKLCADNDVKVKIMFIDATHTLTWVNAEILAYRHLFDEQVVIIMDDCFRADNNTMLPECFANLPGEKVLYPGLHTDNCVGVALVSKADFAAFNPPINAAALTV